MKKTFLTTLRSLVACAMAACAIACFTACSNDDDDKATPAPQTFNGELTTTLPSMPSFEAIKDANTAVVTWDNPEQTSVTVKLGAINISINTPMGPRSYEIGEMTITDVTCVKKGGTITMSKLEFRCMAGTYDTTGSLVGTLKNGTLKFTLLYKPGSMPFEVQSEFEGK